MRNETEKYSEGLRDGWNGMIDLSQTSEVYWCGVRDGKSKADKLNEQLKIYEE